MRILVTGASRRMNLGGPSIYHGLIRVLRHVFPDAGIMYHEDVGNADGFIFPESDDPNLRICTGRASAKKLLLEGWRAKWLAGVGRSSGSLECRLIDEIRRADLLIDAWGIDFTDRLSQMNFKGALVSKPMIRVAALFGVPAVHYTASYGPMTRRWVRMAARQILGKCCTLAFCREEQSRRYLTDCGIPAEKCPVAPDTGFLMPSEPVVLPELDRDRPRLGISVSHQIIRQWSAPTPYLDLIAQLCDRAIEQWNVQVLLIPNELSDTRYDDRAVAREVTERVRLKHDVHVFSAEEHTGPEQKGAIAQCDLFVASRYHSIVASMSQAVPTVVIGWHHKYAELLEQFGQEGVGLSSESCDFPQLWSRCEGLWSQRTPVRETIRAAVPGVEQRILEAGEQLRSLFQ